MHVDMSHRVRLAAAALVAVAALALALAPGAAAKWQRTRNGTVVSYDRRSLMFDGHREIFLSGSIHYPRSPPDMWPELIAKAKEGGLNTIETYVFWNIHEPEKGEFNFEGQNDVVRFFQLIQEHDMYAMVRLGPFIQAEWNHGGLPYWLREIPDIVFRTNNEPYKMHMETFVKIIIKRLKDANLFASQGGPIILAQIENEYQHMEAAFKDEGTKYINWAAKMAISTNIGIPWIMLDLTNNGWGHIVGLVGERKQIYTDKGMGSVTWKPAMNDRPLTWYKWPPTSTAATPTAPAPPPRSPCRPSAPRGRPARRSNSVARR
ncbi:Beta-galactosidase, partial [Zea mays]